MRGNSKVKADRDIALNYLERFKSDIEDYLYYIDKDIEPEIYQGVVSELEAIETTIKVIGELEVE